MDLNDLTLLAVQSGVVLGLTSVIGKFLSDAQRNTWLPLAALILGIGTVLGTEGVTVLLAFKGVILGGTVTGLYSVTKEVKAAPQVVVQQLARRKSPTRKTANATAAGNLRWFL